jgi:phytoene dehydrogenase-like protein
MDMPKTIAIIGAGIAGLAAGCYAQMNGYDSEIYEMHTLPGGLCTAWERKEYVLDGCIHYLFGTGPGTHPLLRSRPAGGTSCAVGSRRCRAQPRFLRRDPPLHDL